MTRYLDAIWPHVGTLVGFGLAFILIARLMSEKRRPSNTFAWMLIIVLVPYFGVPLYILFGGRKIAQRSKTKSPIDLGSENLSQNYKRTAFGILSQGNRTRFIHTGRDAFSTLVEQIRGAQTSIEITTFILSHDSIGRNIVHELSKRAKEGVQIRLLLDAVGSFGKKSFYMLELEQAGGKIERFMPLLPFILPSRANLRNHRKIAIFDKQRAIIGGHNIGRDYMGPAPSSKRWKDFGVLIQGPAVRQFSTIFEADWSFAQKRPADPEASEPANIPPKKTPHSSSIEIMASGPDTEGDPLYEKIISVIQEAQQSITIVTPYYIPDEVLQRSLIVKARSGKHVTLIVPRKSNHRITDLARALYLRELVEADVNVMLYMDGMVHGKMILVDDEIAMTGSANVDLRSLFVNYEIGAFFYAHSDLYEFNKWIQERLNSSLPYAQVYNKPRSLLRETAEDLSRLLTPLL